MRKLLIAILAVLFIFAGCGVWDDLTGPDEPDVKVEVHDNSGDVTINVSDEDVDVESNENAGGSEVTIDSESCCDEEETHDYSECWSSCDSGQMLDEAECYSCLQGERDCIWPWEFETECFE